MKKHLSITLCLLSAFGAAAGAQNVSDALRFSENEYYGTARSMAMGNAFTALGGDLGALNINPAASAVQKYSQFTITPQLSIMAGHADYSSDPYGSGYYTRSHNSKTNFNLPNIAMSFSTPTGRRSGIVNVSFGMAINSTRYFNEDMMAGGDNDRTSYMGYLADIATMDRLIPNELATVGYGQADVFYWPVMVAYRSGMINEYGSGDNLGFVGLAQSTASGNPQRGTLEQTYNRVTSGGKYDYVINFGMNISNKLYLGANLVAVASSYTYDTYLRESALNPADFPVTVGAETKEFNAMKFHYAYSSASSGIYGKFGFIYLPFDGLRIGGAIQTPTINYVEETLWYSGNTQFNDFSASEVISENDEYYYKYNCISPMRFNVGLAYSLPEVGCISVDYEMCDYYNMRFRDSDRNNDYFDDANDEIRDFAGVSHMFRAGAEFNLLPELALRAGYTMTTSPERYFEDGVQKTPNALKQSVAFGFGYKSRGSFFFDFAGRLNLYPAEYIYPYDSYGRYDSPEIINNTKLWNFAATLGWRF